MSTSAAAKFVGQSSEIARYYGFRPLAEAAGGLSAAKLRAPSLVDAAVAVAGARAGEDPVLTFYTTPVKSARLTAHEAGEFALQIFGCAQPMGEIHMLKTLETVIIESGGSIAKLEINCLGDRDSRQRFERELGNFLRRRMGDLEPHLSQQERAKLVESPLGALGGGPEVRALLAEGPRPVHFLSEKSRAHFRSVLEHLEQVRFPYEINDLLAGDERMGTDARIIFRLELSDTATMLIACSGGRYDDFLQRLLGRPYTIIHAGVLFRAKSALRGVPTRRRDPPKIFFIQFGDSAKLTGFSVLEALRSAHISVVQQFDTHHLTEQLSTARSLGVPYVLIMGQREALDGTVIVRSLATSAQTIVSICDLPKHLRALKLV